MFQCICFRFCGQTLGTNAKFNMQHRLEREILKDNEFQGAHRQNNGKKYWRNPCNEHWQILIQKNTC